jgi:Guanine nucleotide exchange factor in Golgi transport N-terminal/Dimerisation and cyclophilin-binding domain of Mon2
VKGELLFALLQSCSSLQAAKTSAVSSTAAATLQQLVISIFDKLVAEDKNALEIPPSAEVPGDDGAIPVRSVAFDAYRVLHDICGLIAGNRPQYIRLSPVPESSLLEIVEAVMVNHAGVLRSHMEQAQILRSTLLPFVIKTFSEKQPFPITVRIARLMFLVIRNHLDQFTSEAEAMLNLLNHFLEPDAAPNWKRVLCMEILRGVFADFQLVLDMQLKYHGQNSTKPVIRNFVGSFVRMASEKPALIGLGQQSTIPVGNYFQRETTEVASDTASASQSSSTAGVGTSTVPGISQQFSSVKTACIEQLDKTEPPTLPDTYIYSLVLACINGLSEGLAKFILPLTVHSTPKSKKRVKTSEQGEGDGSEIPNTEGSSGPPELGRLKRSYSYRKKTVPENPLLREDHPAYQEIKAAAALVEECWPAVLACCSTYFYAALDTEHYRSLVRSYQKFTQVVGLLRMATPRDALLTTLGKAAVPSHVLTSAFSSAGPQSALSPGIKGLLNVENLVNQASKVLPERARRSSLDSSDSSLNSRNLLCLRALLNLAIALGPTLDDSWTIIFETIQQADNIMAASNLRPVSRERASGQTPNQPSNDQSFSQIMSSEITAVQSAASRLFESTVDFPNDAFKHVLDSLCGLLRRKPTKSDTKVSRPQAPIHQRRMASFSGISIKTEAHEQDPVFVLAKIRELASLNLERFVEFDETESGWSYLIQEVTSIATDRTYVSAARLLAAEIVSRLAQDTAASAPAEDAERQDEVQARALISLRVACEELRQVESRSRAQVSDENSFEAHAVMLEALRAILERVGDSLKSGWVPVFEVVRSTFVPTSSNVSNGSAAKPILNPTLRTVGLGRLAFAGLQLICSDFLNGVPDNALIQLTDTLYWFGAQKDDLNVSLTVS